MTTAAITNHNGARKTMPGYMELCPADIQKVLCGNPQTEDELITQIEQSRVGSVHRGQFRDLLTELYIEGKATKTTDGDKETWRTIYEEECLDMKAETQMRDN